MFRNRILATLGVAATLSSTAAVAQSAGWYRFSAAKIIVYVDGTSFEMKGTKATVKIIARERFDRTDGVVMQIQRREYDCAANSYYILDYNSFDVNKRPIQVPRIAADNALFKPEVGTVGRDVLDFVCKGTRGVGVKVADPLTD